VEVGNLRISPPNRLKKNSSKLILRDFVKIKGNTENYGIAPNHGVLRDQVDRRLLRDGKDLVFGVRARMGLPPGTGRICHLESPGKGYSAGKKRHLFGESGVPQRIALAIFAP